MSLPHKVFGQQLAPRQPQRRVVREDGHHLWVEVSDLNARGCFLDCDLPEGEIVSVEVEGTALLMGEILPAAGSGSVVQFFGATSH
jgi:hypothetical protein